MVVSDTVEACTHHDCGPGNANEIKNKTGYSPERLSLSILLVSLSWFLWLLKSMPRAPELVFKLEFVEDISCLGCNTCPIDPMFLIM